MLCRGVGNQLAECRDGFVAAGELGIGDRNSQDDQADFALIVDDVFFSERAEGRLHSLHAGSELIQ